jgi:hypothetical protein
MKKGDVTRRFIENSSRPPTKEEIDEYRAKYRDIKRYCRRRCRVGKITETQREELLERVLNSNVDNFRDVNRCLVRRKKIQKIQSPLKEESMIPSY